MSRLSFKQYIRKLSTPLIFSHLLPKGEKQVFSEALFKDIEARYLEPFFIKERFDELDYEEQELLFTIYLVGERGIIVKDKEVMATLLRSFLVYESVEEEESWLVGFSDCNEAILSLLSTFFTKKEQEVTIEAIAHAMELDSALLLDFARNTVLGKKLDGTLTKSSITSFTPISQLQRLQQELQFSEEILHKTLLAIIDLFVKEHFLAEAGGRLITSPMAIERWKRSNKDELISSFFALFSDKVSLSFIKSLAEQEITLETSFLNNLDDVFQIIILFWAWSGDITVSLLHKRIILKKSAPYRETFVTDGHIMPDFSVFIPREIKPQLLLDFLLMGDIESVDMVFRGKINRIKIENGLAREVDSNLLFSLLKQWHASPNLIMTVKEWILSFEKLFMDRPYLAVKKEITETILQVPEIGEHLTLVEGYNLLRISSGQEDMVADKLTSMGFDIRFPQKDSDIDRSANYTTNVVYNTTPNFEPQLVYEGEIRDSVGMYGGAPRNLSVGEMLKLVKYATVMEEDLLLFYAENSRISEVRVKPLNIRTGDKGFIEGVEASGSVRNFLLENIEKIGVIKNDS